MGGTRRRSWSPTPCARCSRRSTCWSARSRRTCSTSRRPVRRRWELPEESASMTDETRFVYDAAQRGRPARRRGAGGREGDQAQPRQGRLGPPVIAALHLRPRRDHGPAPVHDHADRAGRLGPDLAPPRRDPAQIHAPRLREVVPHAPALPGRPAAPAPVAAEADQPLHRGQRPRRARRGCSRSGCAAPAATCSACCRSSTTPTPIRSAPTWPASSTPSAPGASRRRPQGGPPHRGAGPVPARLRRRPPGRVPLRPVGPPRQERARRPSSRR